jgi:hypothetical protein
MAGVGFMRPDIISGPRREERALPYPPLCPESGDGLGEMGREKGRGERISWPIYRTIQGLPDTYNR